MSATLDRILNRPRSTGSYTFALDPADAMRLAEARDELTAAQEAHDAPSRPPKSLQRVTDAKKAIEALRADVVTVTLTVEAIGPAAYEALVNEHPATDEQQAKHTAVAGGEQVAPLDFNVDTFPPALVAASTTRVELSDAPDDALTSLSSSEAADLWATMARLDQLQVLGMIEALNMRSSRVEDLGKG